MGLDFVKKDFELNLRFLVQLATLEILEESVKTTNERFNNEG